MSIFSLIGKLWGGAPAREKKAVNTPLPKGPSLPEGIGEPVWTIAQSIMKDKKRWKLSYEGSPFEDLVSGFNLAPHGRYTFNLLDTKTGECFQFLACGKVLWRYCGYAPCTLIPVIDRYTTFCASWITKKEQTWLVEILGSWYSARLKKLKDFQAGKNYRAQARSDKLKQVLADKERNRVLEIYK